MSGRFAYAFGLAVAIALSACYDVPQPDCGFVCGPPAVPGGEGTCPDGYTCFDGIDNRCHRMSPAFSDPCPGDAGPIVDLRPPRLIDRDPAPGATDVALDRAITLEFDERIQNYQFPNFQVEDSNGIILGDLFEDGFGEGIRYRFQPQQSQRPWLQSTVHTVTLTSDITDDVGNQLVPTSWQFTTLTDTTPPMVTFTMPASGATGVSISTTVNVQFSEPVLNVDGTTFRLTGPSGPVVAAITTVPVLLDPVDDLAPNTQYTVTLSSGITDTSGNPLPFTSFTFTTAADTTPPQLGPFPSPQNGQIGVSVLPSISITFTEPVTNVTTSTFLLRDGMTPLSASLLNVTSTSATLRPRRQLVANTAYNYVLTPGILDLAGNPLIMSTVNFTTGADFVEPRELARSPATNATGVAIDTVVTIDFDEPVVNATTTLSLSAGATAIPATVTYDTILDRATLTPTQPLAANTTYTVTLGELTQDAAGNMRGFDTTWMFTTGADTVAPRILSTLPADTATGVALDATISVTFDEAVSNVDGTSFVVMNGGTGTLASSNGGRTWTFTPDAAFAPTTTVTILLTQAITDSASNTLAAPFSFAFTTGP